MDTHKSREEILKRLKICSLRPESAVSSELVRTPVSDVAALFDTFSQNLAIAAGSAYRAGNNEEALQKLGEMLSDMGASSALLSADDMIPSPGVPAFVAGKGIAVHGPAGSADEQRGKAFSVDVGITGADYAIADTGTVVLLHHEDNPRLISLSPPNHIVLLPIERLLPDIDTVVAEINPGKGEMPSAITLITGPSMTADIAIQPTYGMHGPKTVQVIFVG